MQEFIIDLLKAGGIQWLGVIGCVCLGLYILKKDKECSEERKATDVRMAALTDKLLLVIEGNTRVLQENTTFMKAKLERPYNARERASD